ncbi:MAG: transposase family protein [Bacteroidetes bacterium]|nr:MAG: transposase family protein [Bacteroidota bacterium]
MNYKEIRKRTKQFESVTGLKVEEFDKLHTAFSAKWRNFYRIHRINGTKRTAPLMNPDKETKTLPSTQDKLFFILVYLKNYSLQEMLAASFGFSQSQASKWQKVLIPLLQQALKTLDMSPARTGSAVKPILEKLQETQCFQDVSERSINRPQDSDTQEVFYSGKKKSTR